MSSNYEANGIRPGEPNSISTVMIQDATVTDAKLSNTDGVHAAGMSRQAFMNGNFDIWQRGTTFTNPATNTLTSDRIRMQYTNTGTLPTNIVHSRIRLTPGDVMGSMYAYRVSVDGAGSGFGTNNFYMFAHNVENGIRFLNGAGRSLTLSFYAKSDIPGKKIGVSVANFYGSGGSPSGADVDLPGNNFALTSSWQRYSWTMATVSPSGKTLGTNDDDFISVRFFLMWGANFNTQLGAGPETFGGSGNIDITQVQLCVGDTALPFEPRTPAEELALCQRYYETSYNVNVPPGTATTIGSILTSTDDNTASGNSSLSVNFQVLKRVAPAVTVYGTSGTANTVNDGTSDRAVNTGNLFQDVGQYGFNQSYTLTGATGSARKFHFTADCEL